MVINHAVINTAHFLSNHWFLSLFSLCDFFCKSCRYKSVFHVNIIFGQKFTRNIKNGFECVLSEVELLQFLTQYLCGFWSRIGGRVKISKPSNLSSALHYTWAGLLKIVHYLKDINIQGILKVRFSIVF